VPIFCRGRASTAHRLLSRPCFLFFSDYLVSDFREPMRRASLDAPEWIQRQEVSVSSDNVRPLSAHRQFEELVVLRVTASLNLYFHVNPLCFARRGSKKGPNIFLMHIMAESLSA
jgi:hypothetical protein